MTVGIGQVLRFNGAVKRDAAIEAWMQKHSDELAAIASHWFEVMRTADTMFESYCTMAIRQSV